MHPRRSARTLLLLLVLCGCGGAQTFDYQTQRKQLISVDGKWRFHAGDDPRWADPNFDDSRWSLLRSDQLWGKQGYKGYAGFGWYRFHLEQAGKLPLSLLLPGFATYYQVFVNGQFVAEGGKLPPDEIFATKWAVYPIPPAAPAPDLCVAIRVWANPRWAVHGGGGPYEKGAVLGAPPLVAQLYEAHQSKLIASDLYRLAVDLVMVFTIATMLSLFFFTGFREYEYLWYGLFQLLVITQSISYLYGEFASASYRLYRTANIVGDVATIFEFLFFVRILEAPRNWLYWLVWARIACVILASASGFDSPIFAFCAMAVYYVWIFWATWRGAWRGLLDARLVMFPLYLLCFRIALSRISALPGRPDWVAKIFESLYYREFPLGPIRLSLGELDWLLVLLSIWALLIARFVRTRREEQQHATELAAARAVQHMLIPDKTPAIPEFSIASVYQPAHVVGGDFFQIIPASDGVLIAIGDVSGKGLPAAMTVSLIVGTLRTLAEQTTSPAAILQGLNRRLEGRGTGFTTCLIAFLGTDGDAVLANAGHPPPYRNGEEITTISDLPLGLSPDTRYAESPVALRPKDCLTFVSDGVVEAKNAKGELFGFERTRLNSTQPADAIATLARQFGQEDDITVLTVEYCPMAMAY